MDTDDCTQPDPMTIIYTTVKVGLCISSVLFLIAVVLVPALKLHKLLVYRLALYQVISAKLCLIALALLIFGPLSEDGNVEIAVCASIVSLKLVLTVWITFHLFILSVWHKNLKKLELLYVGSSIIVTAIIFIVTLELEKKEENEIDAFYSNGSANSHSNATFVNYLQHEFIALISVASFLLLISFLFVVVMVVTLCCRAIKRIGIASVNQKQHKKVLYEMMPLLAYPIMYLILITPIIVLMVMTFFGVNVNRDDIEFYEDFFTFGIYGSPVAVLLWSITCSCALIIHVSIVLCNKKRKHKQEICPNGNDTREGGTINETTTLVGRSETYYSLPIED